MRIVPHHIIDSDTLPHPSIQATPITTSPAPPSLPPSSDTTLTVHPPSVEAEGTVEQGQRDTSVHQQDNQLPPRRSTRVRKPAEWYTDSEQQTKYTHAAKVLFVKELFNSLQTTGTQQKIHHPRIMKLVHAPAKPETPPPRIWGSNEE